MFVLFLEWQMPNNVKYIVCYGYKKKVLMLIYYLKELSHKILYVRKITQHEKENNGLSTLGNFMQKMTIKLAHFTKKIHRVLSFWKKKSHNFVDILVQICISRKNSSPNKILTASFFTFFKFTKRHSDNVLLTNFSFSI
jgi:hypothetical protein